MGRHNARTRQLALLEQLDRERAQRETALSNGIAVNAARQRSAQTRLRAQTWLQFTPAGEDIRYQSTPRQVHAVGTLARDVLQTITLDKSPREARLAVHRLEKWAGPPPGKTRRAQARGRLWSRRALCVISCQLRAWAEQGGVTWSHWSHEGSPTPELNNLIGQSLVSELQWRAPAHGEYSEALAVTTPEAAVFVSALHGAFRGSLVACLRCHRLSVQQRGPRLRRCPFCPARRGVPETVQRTYIRVRDRIRYGSALDKATRARLLSELRRLREQSAHGIEIAANIVKRMEAIMPITTKRGRPRG